MVEVIRALGLAGLTRVTRQETWVRVAPGPPSARILRKLEKDDPQYSPHAKDEVKPIDPLEER